MPFPALKNHIPKPAGKYSQLLEKITGQNDDFGR
jgi:hypothetical protein